MGDLPINIFRLRSHGRPLSTPLERFRWQLAGLATVIAAHFFLVRLFPPLLPGAVPAAEREIKISVISSPRLVSPLPEPILERPNSDIVPAPEIAMEDLPTPTAVTAVSTVVMAQVIPPRPDPAHPNAAPELPAGIVKPGRVSALVMVFVNVDGAITDARVTSSTGDSSLDKIALAFVKAQWRFLPASFSDRRVAEWTTVLVPFRT
jgi:TonB family protein